MIGQQQLTPTARHQHPTKVAGHGDGHQLACPQDGGGPACCFLCPRSSQGWRLNQAPKTTWKCCAQVSSTGGSGNKVWQNKQKRLLFNKKIPYKSIRGFDERMKQWSFRTKTKKENFKLLLLKGWSKKTALGNQAPKWNHRLCCKDYAGLPWNGHSNELWTWTRNWYTFQ